MRKEKSCGAVVYQYINNKLYILLLKHNQGHWSYPKGHVEAYESELETALREVKEETNLDVRIDNNFRKIITYQPSENAMKDVVYFVATPTNHKIIAQEEEISQIQWFDYEKAQKIITYEEDRKLLELAVNYIEKSKKHEKNSSKS